MADQHSAEGVGRPIVAVESSESKDVTDQHSDVHVSTNSVPVVSLESTNNVANQHSDKDSSTSDVVVGSLESTDLNNQAQHSRTTDVGVGVGSLESTDLKNQAHGKDSSTTNVVGSLGSTDLTDQDSGKDSGIADVPVGSLESDALTIQDSGKGSSTNNVSVGSLESTGLTNQDPAKGSSKSNVSVGSLDLTGAESQDSGKDLKSTANESVRNSESTGLTNKDSGKSSSTSNVSVGSLGSTGVANQDLGEDSTVANEFVRNSESTGLTNKDSGKGSSTSNVSVGSLGTTGVANQDSGEDSSVANEFVRSSESSGLTNQDSGKGLTSSNVSVGSLDPKHVEDQDSGKDSTIANGSVRSLELTGVADQHSDEGVSMADVALESLKSKAIADKSPDEDALKTNDTIEHSESSNSGTTVEINIMTLDSQLHSFNVDKNMPVAIFKEKIATEIGLPVEQQRIIFRGRVLKDEDLLSEYHVESGHTLHLVSRQPSEFQLSSDSHNAETSVRSGNTGQDANVTGTRPRVGHVSHSVVLGTFGVGDQDEGSNPDVSQVIGAVLNSFGIGAQAPVGGIGVGHPNMQLQVAQGNETRSSVNNHGETGNQSQGLQIPQGAVPDVPTLSMPIPDSLNTLSEFMNHMERVLSQNGYQPANSNSYSNNRQGLPAVQLNARGLPSPAALAVVMRHAQRLLSGPAVDSLSHTAKRLEEEEGSTDVTLRTQIQTDAMQSGLAMQHLGALLLELGRTILTLRIGQSSAESSVNAGPAVYISPSGPNPIMVQPFPLQTNSLFGSEHTPAMNHGAFGGTVPQHLNIHIHAGPRATNVESNQGEVTNENAGVNSQCRSIGDSMTRGNEVLVGQTDARLPQVLTDTRDTGNATSSNTRIKSLSETEAGLSSSQRSNNTTPKTASAIPLGLGPGGLQPKKHRQTRSEAGSSTASSSFANQSLTSTGSQMDPATIMNQIMQNPALSNMLTSVSNQNGAGSSDFLRNMFNQLAQNPAMMNTVNQLAQQMDGNQDLGSMGGGNLDMSNMLQQMMPLVSQALNRGTSTPNLPKSTPSRKGTLHRRYSSVKSLNINERPSDFQMNLENAAQKIVEQYPPLEIFSSIVTTAASLHNNVYDTTAIDELCMEEELAQEFIEMLKRDISQRLRGAR